MHTDVHLFKATSGPRMSAEAHGGRALLTGKLISFGGVITLVHSRKRQRAALGPPGRGGVRPFQRQTRPERTLKEVIIES